MSVLAWNIYTNQLFTRKISECIMKFRDPYEERKAAAEGRAPVEPRAATRWSDQADGNRQRNSGSSTPGGVASSLDLFVGLIWGMAASAALAFANANFEKFVADDARGVLYALILFAFVSFLVAFLGALRRLFSSSFRAARGWSKTIGFVLGLALAPITLAVAGAQ